MEEKEILKDLIVVYVEDSLPVQKVMEIWFKQKGIKAYFGSNGEEGFNLFLNHNPDLVITDIQMPVIDGIKMSEMIKERSPETPIIILTAFNEKNYLFRALEIGIDDYLMQPVHFEHFERVLLKYAKQLKTLEEKRHLQNLLIDKNMSLIGQSLYLESVLENAPNTAFIVMDPDLVVRYINKLACDIFELELKKIKYKKLLKNIKKESLLKTIIQDALEIITNDKRYNNIVNINDGVYEITVYRINRVGEKINGLVLRAHDITELQKTKDDLIASKESAEYASRAKSEFLAIMGHELRTPLTGIIGMTELTLDSGLSDEQSEYLKVAKSSAVSLLGIVNDILDFSKMETGKFTINSIDFNLGTIISEIIKTMAVKAYEKNIEFMYYIDPNVPENLIGDPDRLKQVLLNLIGNAIKFTENGQVLLYIQKRVKDTSDNSNISLQFSVYDTGIGVPQEKQSSIFNAFVQADGSFSRQHGGIGLGLSIGAHLVHLMGGDIWVESPADFEYFYSDTKNENQVIESSVSCAFHFNVVFEIRHNFPENKSEWKFKTPEGYSVLIATKNGTLSYFLNKYFSIWKAEATFLFSNKDVQQDIQKNNNYDLIMLDFNILPVNEELKYIAELKNHLDDDTAILAITNANTIIEEDLENKIYFITKPINYHELAAKIKKLISENGNLSLVLKKQLQESYKYTEES